MIARRLVKLLFVAMVGVLLWMTVSAFWGPRHSTAQSWERDVADLSSPQVVPSASSSSALEELIPKKGIVDPEQARLDHETHKSAPRSSARRPKRSYSPDQPISHDGFGRAMLEWGLLGSTSFNGSKPEFVKNLASLDGQPATLVGFMSPLEDVGQLRTFMLLEYPVGCFYCLVPDPAGIVLVDLKAGKTEPLRYEPVRVAGKLRLNDTDPEDFLYILEDAEVLSLD
ncbi:MAG: DUF3299 domain-containing protein [Planctomycetota bacterium]